MELVDMDNKLQINELRAYLWDHISSLADPNKVTSSNGPTNTPDADPQMIPYGYSATTLLAMRRANVIDLQSAMTGFAALGNFQTNDFYAWFRVELASVSLVEAIVITSMKGKDVNAQDVWVFVTMSDDINAIPEEDFLPGTFSGDSVNESFGKEWLTGSKPARFVGAFHRKSNPNALILTSFAVLGTADLCSGKIQDLVDAKAIPDYEEIVTVQTGDQLAKTLAITKIPLTDAEVPLLGDQYQNCVDL